MFIWCSYPPPAELCFKEPEMEWALDNTLVSHIFPEQSLLKLERTHLVKTSLAVG